MAKKNISSFATVYIIGGMLYILFLFYYIGTEIQRVKASERIITEKEAELQLLKNIRDERAKTKKIMLTEQYQDRIKKEIEGSLNEGEKEYIVHIQKKEDSPLLEPDAHLYWQKPTIEEWQDVFFHTEPSL